MSKCLAFVEACALKNRLTESHAPIAIGGIPDVKARKLRYAIELPDMLSIMTYHNPDAVVRGLNSFAEKD